MNQRPTKRKLKTSINWTQLVANGATIIAAITAIFTLFQVQGTLKATRDTLEHERESKAAELSLKYDDLMGETERDSSWKNLAAIDIAESIFRLRGGEKSWQRSVEGMIGSQKTYLEKWGLECDNYDGGFIEMVKKQVPEVCSSH